MMPRALSRSCRSAALIAGALAIALAVFSCRPPTGADPGEDDELFSAMGRWMTQDRTLEDRWAAANSFHDLLQEMSDAVVAEQLPLAAATQRLHEFCEARCPEQLRYNTFCFELDSTRTEMRVRLLWNIRALLARGDYAEVPPAVAERFSEIPDTAGRLPEQPE